MVYTTIYKMYILNLLSRSRWSRVSRMTRVKYLPICSSLFSVFSPIPVTVSTLNSDSDKRGSKNDVLSKRKT